MRGICGGLRWWEGVREGRGGEDGESLFILRVEGMGAGAPLPVVALICHGMVRFTIRKILIIVRSAHLTRLAS